MEQACNADCINLLVTNIDRIDYRLKYAEMLHRKVGPDADIYHYERIVPKVVGAAAFGAIITIAAYHLFK